MNLSRTLSHALLPGAGLNHPAEGKQRKEDAKGLGALEACQTGMKCPFVSQASVKCLVQCDATRPRAWRTARSGFRARLCRLPPAVTLAKF